MLILPSGIKIGWKHLPKPLLEKDVRNIAHDTTQRLTQQSNVESMSLQSGLRMARECRGTPLHNGSKMLKPSDSNIKYSFHSNPVPDDGIL
jgi:hypothetical protein